jgi:trans-2,3-dihydro-3-hydroxyanthranilate isomerase
VALHFHTLDVFTDRPFGGNPLAVFPEAGDLDGEGMAAIAREFNLSETVFVLPPRIPGALRRLRIFTPGRELPFAGHPTVGTAILLSELGISGTGGTEGFVLEEEGGPIPVRVRTNPDGLTFAQLSVASLPFAGPPAPPVPLVAEMLRLSPSDVGGDVVGMSAGVPFLMVPVANVEALTGARLDLGRWQATLASYWATEVFLFARTAGNRLRARMFAPAMGITEDPATGAAAAALAGYLAVRSGQTDGMLTWNIEQGVEMGRPSVIEIEADLLGGHVSGVRVGGTAIRMSEGVFRMG